MLSNSEPEADRRGLRNEVDLTHIVTTLDNMVLLGDSRVVLR